MGAKKEEGKDAKLGVQGCECMVEVPMEGKDGREKRKEGEGVAGERKKGKTKRTAE